jgi:hypothetical protein
MTITLNLRPEVLQRLREKAAFSGQTVEAYLEQLVAREIRGKSDAECGAPQLTDQELDQLLDELSSGPPLPPLPGDFSRADVYVDHD